MQNEAGQGSRGLKPRVPFSPGRRSSLIGPCKKRSRHHVAFLERDRARCVLLQYPPRALLDIGQTLVHAQTDIYRPLGQRNVHSAKGSGPQRAWPVFISHVERANHPRAEVYCIARAKERVKLSGPSRYERIRIPGLGSRDREH